MIRLWFPLMLVAVTVAAPALAQRAAASSSAPKAVSCIDSNQIQGREGESERTILFHMSGGITY